MRVYCWWAKGPYILLWVILSQEYTRGRGKPRRGTASSVVTPHTKECVSFSARHGMFHPYCTWGREFLILISLSSTDNRWLRSWQPLRNVAQFVAPFTLAKERLPCRTSACLCLKCTPGFILIILLKWFVCWKTKKESMFNLGLNGGKTANYIEKYFKEKLFRIKFPTKNSKDAFIYLPQESG